MLRRVYDDLGRDIDRGDSVPYGETSYMTYAAPIVAAISYLHAFNTSYDYDNGSCKSGLTDTQCLNYKQVIDLHFKYFIDRTKITLLLQRESYNHIKDHFFVSLLRHKTCNHPAPKFLTESVFWRAVVILV